MVKSDLLVRQTLRRSKHFTRSTTRLGQGANTALPIWAKFYKKASSLPKYKSGSFFSESDSTIIQKFNCNFHDDTVPIDNPLNDVVIPNDTMPIYNDSKKEPE